MRAASSRAPGAPSGQGSVPPGTSANRRATWAMTWVGTTPAHATSAAPRDQTSEVRAAATPAMVATGTSGAASRLADDADQADRALQQHDDGRGHGLGRHRDRQRGPETAEPAGEPGTDRVAPRTGEQQQAEGGQRGEHEPERAGQPRVDEEHHHDRRAEDRWAGRAPRPAQPEQPDRAHGRRSHAHSARGGRARRTRRGRPGRAPAAAVLGTPTSTQQPEGEAGDDSDVAAAHRREVGHAGGPHGLGEVGRGAAGVTDDQARQQSPRVGRCVVDRLAQAGTKPLGRRGDGARRPRTTGGPRTDRVATRSSARSVGPNRPCTRTVERHAASAIAGITGQQYRGGGGAPEPTGVEHVDSGLAEHHRPVTSGGEHDGVTGEYSDGRDRRAVTSERLDVAAGSQDAVPRRRHLQRSDERHGEQDRPHQPDPAERATNGCRARDGTGDEGGRGGHHQVCPCRETQPGSRHRPGEHRRPEQPEVGRRPHPARHLGPGSSSRRGPRTRVSTAGPSAGDLASPDDEVDEGQPSSEDRGALTASPVG